MICHSCACAKNEEVLPRLPNLNTDVENWYRFKTRKIDQSQRAYVLKDILNIVQNLLENQKIQNWQNQIFMAIYRKRNIF